MSIETTLARVASIRQALADPAQLIGSGAGSSGGTEAPGSTTSSSPFVAALARAGANYPAASAAAALEAPAAALEAPASAPAYPPLAGVAYQPYGAQAATPGARIVQAAESQLGQAEQPPGSNESPAIATYRGATAGAMPGAPWCAYFASWVAREAGKPIGASGEGLGSAGEIWSWAQSTGRAVANGPGVVPKPGDLIVFGNEHVGIVRAVLPGGQIQTIEGNYENKVAANVRSPSEATGYVEMG